MKRIECRLSGVGERLPLSLGGLVRWDIGTTSGDCGCQVAKGGQGAKRRGVQFRWIWRCRAGLSAARRCGWTAGWCCVVRSGLALALDRPMLAPMTPLCVRARWNRRQEGDGEGRRDGAEEKREMLAALYDRHAITAGGPPARKATPNGNRSAAAGMIPCCHAHPGRSRLAQPPTPRLQL